jgi:hypothetical protein
MSEVSTFSSEAPPWNCSDIANIRFAKSDFEYAEGRVMEDCF